MGSQIEAAPLHRGAALRVVRAPAGDAPRRSAWLPVLLVLFGLPASIPVSGDSREEEPLLVRQLAGNCYERRVLDAAGRLTGHQRIHVHETARGPSGARVRIDVIRFETGGRAEGELRVKKRFDFQMIGEVRGDAQEEAALQIVGYVGSDSRVALDFLDESLIYPDEPCTGQPLPPIRLNLSAQGGLVKLLGGRAEIRMTDRKCRAAGREDGRSQTYFIDGVLKLKMFLLGIPLKNDRYSSRHWVDPRRGLLRHVLEDPDGGHQELAMVDRSACSPPWRPVAAD